MAQHVVRFSLIGLLAVAVASEVLLGQDKPPVVPALVAPPQSDFAPGVPRYGASGVTSPKLVKSVDPKYSGDAIRTGIQGTVILEGLIGVDGLIEDSRVQCSLHPTLDLQAQNALREWSFKPALLAGVPTRFVATFQMEFRLKRGELPEGRGPEIQPFRKCTTPKSPPVVAGPHK